MKRLVFVSVVIACLGGCAVASKPIAIESDWRTGTDHTPYRSIAPAIQCDGCRY
jgi:hypothetical protein